ncbi:putative furin A, partial [Triplophysa rosa]
DLRLALLTLGTLLILVTSGPRPSIGQKVFINTWAVHIAGGEQEADRIAKTHGFVNQGNDLVRFQRLAGRCPDRDDEWIPVYFVESIEYAACESAAAQLYRNRTWPSPRPTLFDETC